MNTMAPGWTQTPDIDTDRVGELERLVSTLQAERAELVAALQHIDATELDSLYSTDTEKLWRCLNVARAALKRVQS